MAAEEMPCRAHRLRKLNLGFAESCKPFSLGSLVGKTTRLYQRTSTLDFLCQPSSWRTRMHVFLRVCWNNSIGLSPMCEFIPDKMLVSIGPAAGSVLAVTFYFFILVANCQSQKYDVKNMGESASSRDLIWIHFNLQHRSV